MTADNTASVPEEPDDRLAACPVGLVRVTDGTVQTANDAAADLLGTERAALAGTEATEAFPTSVEATLSRLFLDGEPTERREFEEYYPDVDRWLAVTVAPGESVTDVYLRDVTDRVMAKRRVTELEGELDRLSIITDLLSDVLVGIVDASDREEIAETICERLGGTDLYEFAWLAEREPGGDGLRVRAAAGATGETFERVKDHLAETPERAAAESGEVRVVQPVADDPDVPAAIRQAAFADGIQSALAVPLTYGDTTYGVVGVYAASQDAFSERARESFTTLGSMAGFAVNAARNRNLLFADTVTELTFDVTDRDAPFVSASATLETTIAVEGTVPQDQDRVLCYVTADESDGEAAADQLRTEDGVETVRVVADHDEETRLEVVVSEGTPLRTVSALGVTVGGATYEDGRGRITAELPSGEEVRRVAEAIRRRFEADTVAKVERDRSVTTAGELREELSDRLTDRQETALRTAFLAGYFESPRDSTAEEVGDALDITGSTLLHHLRAGQRKLLDSFLDADRDRALDSSTGFDPLDADE